MFIENGRHGFRALNLASLMSVVVRYKLLNIILVLVFCQNKMYAQLKIGDNPTTIKAASLLEMESGNKGFVLPRVALTALTNYAPLAADLLEGTVVYNSNITLPGGPGIYIWKGTGWVKLQADDLGNHTATQNLDLANKLLVGNGGSSGLAISNSGNVGIGTAGPFAKLEVANTMLVASGVSTAQKIDQLLSNSTIYGLNGLTQQILLPKGSTVSKFDVYTVGAGTGNFTFTQVGGAALATFSVSYVGGLTSVVLPTPVTLTNGGLYSITVEAATNFFVSSDNPYVDGIFYYGNSPQPTNDLKFAIYFTSPIGLYVAKSGNVGLGTLSPIEKLDVAGNVQISGTGYGLKFPDGTTQTTAATTMATVTASNGLSKTANDITLGGALIAATNIPLGNYNLTFSGNGNVGIGNATPATKLDVTGSGRFVQAGGSLILAGAGVGSHTYMEFYTNGIAGGRTAWLGYGGNGSTTFTINNHNGTDLALATPANMYLQTNGANRLFLQGSNGFVGIGNTSPSVMLDVTGSTRLRGLTTAGVVTTDANGNLSSSAAATINPVTVSNGLTKTAADITLGGTLSSNTTIAQGTNNLLFTGTGRMGIGTASPSVKLDVTGQAQLVSAGEGLRLAGTGTGSFTYTSFYPDGAAGTRRAYLGYNAANNQNFTLENEYTSGDMSLATGQDLWVRTGGNNRLIVKGNTGNVGIGTINPQRKLQVMASGYGITQTNGTVELGTYLDDTYGWLGTASNHGLAFFTNDGGVSMLVNTAGNVGIGTENPGAKLDVNGTIKIADGSQGANKILTSDASGLASWQTPAVATVSNGLTKTGDNITLGGSLTTATNIAMGTNNLVFTGIGNVGIGTATPTVPLAVMTSGTTTAINKGVFKIGTATNNGNDNWWMGFSHSGNSADANDRARIGVNIAAGGAGRLFFTTGNSGTQAERMRIDENGNIGVGTSSPAQKLDVNGNANITGSATVAGNVSVNIENAGFIADALGFARVGLMKYSGHAGGLWRVAGQGLEIGRTDGTSLTTTPTTLNVDLMIDGGGNVGIGTNSPTAKLDVNGSTRLRGLTTAGFVTTDANGNLSSSGNLVTTASNGLTKNNNDVLLGGTLTTATTINQNGNFFAVQGSGSTIGPLLISNVFTVGGAYVAIIPGQSFTMPTAGTITSITIYNMNNVASGNVTLKLFNGNGSSPTYTQVVPATFGLTTYTLNTPQSLSAGLSRYEFTNGPPGGANVFLAASSSDNYSGGRAYYDGSPVVTDFDTYFVINYLGPVPVASLHISAAGNVGIGTNSPGSNAKLEIYGGISKNPGSYRYMNNSGEGNAGGGGTYSLYTSNRIWCGEEINITSDSRTKTNIHSSNTTADLALINKLRVVNYNYKDKVTKGNTLIKGFVAQEVEQVMPDAVTQNKGVVPNIYQNASALHYDASTKILKLTLPSTTLLQPGDTVKLITEKGEQLVHVLAVQGNQFTIGNWQTNIQWAFVYGTQVNDLRNLDYNKLFSAGISAIQQLSKQNDELRKDNTTMRQDVDTLKAQMKALLERLNTTVKTD